LSILLFKFRLPCNDGKGSIQIYDGTKFNGKDIALKNKCGSLKQASGDFNKFSFPVKFDIPGCSDNEIEEVFE
jgi:hypothetical protein